VRRLKGSEQGSGSACDRGSAGCVGWGEWLGLDNNPRQALLPPHHPAGALGTERNSCLDRLHSAGPGLVSQELNAISNSSTHGTEGAARWDTPQTENISAPAARAACPSNVH